ncbi:MAG: hypothetical protein U1F25_01945 [Rubrivivax sp.]
MRRRRCNYAAIGTTTVQLGAAGGYNDTQFISLPANVSGIELRRRERGQGFALSLFGATANRFLELGAVGANQRAARSSPARASSPTR